MPSKKSRLKLKKITALFCVIMCGCSFMAFSQDPVSYIYNFPVKAGYMYKFNDNRIGFIDPSPYIDIFSKDSSVYSIANGEIIKYAEINGSGFLYLKSGDNILVYSNLERANITKGKVRRGDLIGSLKKAVDEKDCLFELTFQILAQNFSNLNYFEVYKFLLQNSHKTPNK